MTRKHTRRAGSDTGRETRPEPGARTRIAPEERIRMIAEAAYYRAERRGFATGGGMDDWVRAETEIDRLIQTDASHATRAARVA